MNRRFKFLLPAILCMAALLLPAVAGSARQRASRWDQQAGKRKADYLFLEAQRYHSLDSAETYLGLLERAYMMDTTDTGMGAQLGLAYVGSSVENSMMEGIRLMGRHFKANPADRDNTLLFGNVSMVTSRFYDAVAAYSALDSIYPTPPIYKDYLIQALVRQDLIGNHERILDELNKFETISGLSPNIVIARTEQYLAVGDSLAAIESAKKLVRERPLDSYGYSIVSTAFYYLGQLDSALVYSNRACELAPDNSDVRSMRSHLYLEMGDTAAYENDVVDMLQNADFEAEAKLELLYDYTGEMLQDSTQIPRVTELYEHIIEKYPYEPEYRLLYAELLRYDGREYPEAAEQLETYLDLNPSASQQWGTLISIYLSEFWKMDQNTPGYAKLKRKLKTAAERAIEYFPDDLKIVLISQLAYQTLEDYRAAISLCEEFIRRNPDCNPEDLISIFETMSNNYNMLGDKSKALHYSRLAYEIEPDNPMQQNNYAYFLSENDLELGLAEELSFKTLIAEPDNAVYLDTYAWILYKLGRFEEARTFIDHAIEVYDRELDDEIVGHAREIYQALSNPEAQTELERVIENHNAAIETLVDE